MNKKAVYALYFLIRLIYVCCKKNPKIITFETMMDESISIAKNKRIILKEKKKSFEDKIFIFFSFSNKVPCESIVNMQEHLFDYFSVKKEKLQKPIIAIEHRISLPNDFACEKKVNKFFNKILEKLHNQDAKIDVISPTNPFYNMHIVGNKAENNSIFLNYKEVFIFEENYKNEVEEYIYWKSINQIFKNYLTGQYFCFFSNFNLSKSDFDLCLKYYKKELYTENSSEKNVGFLVLQVGKENLQKCKDSF